MTNAEVPLPPTRVLVVEDHPGVRAIATTVLQRKGYDVLAVGSSRDALLVLETPPERVDVVLADLRLADGSGLDVIAHAKRLRPRVRTVLATGAEIPAGHGADAILPKPFTAFHLLEVLHEALGRPAETPSLAMGPAGVVSRVA